MGTNYFFRQKRCEHCGAGLLVGPALHVGKSSVGWQFLFRAHPDLGITSVADWRRRIAEAPDGLFNSYDASVTQEDFWKMVEAKRDGRRLDDDGVDSEGYRIVEHEFS